MNRLLQIISAIVVALALTSCSTGGSTQSQNRAAEDTLSDSCDLPTCASPGECATYDGEKVAIIGTYTVVDLHAGRGPKYEGRAVVVRIDLPGEGGDGPYLEPFWHRNAQRPESEIEAFEGQRVRVIGVFHSEMPPDPKAPPGAGATPGGAVLHPVDSIEAID